MIFNKQYSNKLTIIVCFTLSTFLSAQSFAAEFAEVTEVTEDKNYKENKKDNCKLYEPKIFKQSKIKNASDKRIGKVKVCVLNVFDPSEPKENKAIFRLANFLHITTNHKYINEQLLFEPGDSFNGREIQESERILRNNDYIQSADISTTPNPNNPDEIDILVKTSDSWTTQPTFSFGSGGGKTTSSIGLREDNLFGEGIRFSIKHRRDIDRDSTQFKYSDKTFISSNKSIYLEYENSTDGFVKAINIEKPYSSLNTNTNYGFNYRKEIRQNGFFILEREDYYYDNVQEKFDVFFGKSKGFLEEKTIRHTFGLQSNYDFIDNIVDNSPNKITAQKDISDYPVQAVDTENYAPYYEIKYIQDKFKKVYNVRSINKGEDRNYGYEISLRTGFSDTSLYSDEKKLFQEFSLTKAFNIGKHAEMAIENKVALEKVSGEDLHARTQLNFEYLKTQIRQYKFYSSIDIDYSANEVNGDQVYLDNITGLRGYPIRYLTGKRSIKFSAEERIYFKRNLWEVIDVGAALFYDIGFITGEAELDQFNIPYYRSFGIGLRLGSKRASSLGIFHLDLAKPLDLPNDDNSFKFAIELKDKF